MSGNSFILQEVAGTNVNAFLENASSGGAELNDIVALNASDKCVASTDAASIRVIGVCAGETESGTIQVVNGIFVLKNDTTNAVTRAHIGKACFVKDKATVSSARGTNGVVAGIVVDVTDDGVAVDMTPNALAIGRVQIRATAIADLTAASATATQCATAINQILALLRTLNVISNS